MLPGLAVATQPAELRALEARLDAEGLGVVFQPTFESELTPLLSELM